MEDIKVLLLGNQRLLIVLLVFMILDIITGVIKAVIGQELKSSKFREGLLKKCLEVIIVIIGFSCDWAFNLQYIGNGCIVCLVAMECWSIIENIELYIPIPSVIKQFLENVRSKEEVK